MLFNYFLGIEEARQAGRDLKKAGYKFDLVFTSVLTRAIQTYNYAADEMGCHYLPIIRHWRLNEKHYGDLQGLNKSETAQKFGEKQVLVWRRSYDVPPADLAIDNPRCNYLIIIYNIIKYKINALYIIIFYIPFF